ncbi:hypothetical protein [Cupriavidus sp. SK-3]|uniref:hypothetical protein n=1 Tax=Cupriavidus TaxID=106589 RepID=UPI0039C87F9B
MRYQDLARTKRPKACRSPRTFRMPPRSPRCAPGMKRYEGLSSRDAVAHFLGERKANGQSARGLLGLLGHIRRQLAEYARRWQRPDLAAWFAHGAAARIGRAKAVGQSIDLLRHLLEKSGRFAQPCEDAVLHDFAGDVDPARARVLYAEQGPISDTLFASRTTQAAWRAKPTWYAVSANDRTTSPDLERFLAKRMNAKTIELASSHVSMLSLVTSGCCESAVDEACRTSRNKALNVTPPLRQ